MSDDGFELTIHGLLRKRGELLSTLEHHRNQVAAAMNDLHAVDRVLNSLGYDGSLDLAQPRKKVLSYIRVEVRRHILEELRDAGRPMTTRELSVALATKEGRDAGDRRMMLDFTKRVSKSVSILADKQVVRRTKVPGGQGYQYELAR
ncbi:MAG: hypothetical protein ACKVP4_02695 [Hyphomicrobium sp.]